MHRSLAISYAKRVAIALIGLVPFARAAESPYLYGIHDHDPAPTEYLNRITSAGRTGWITATVAVGHNPADTGGVNFTSFSGAGHTVVCRINNGYCGDGTIPAADQYANFAQRCANFVQNSPGCEIWVIGNETNLASEWPPVNGRLKYVSPQDYANCFRQCYNAIKAVRPTHKVVSQALAPWGGPYGTGNACGYPHDAMPLNWVQYLNQMLTAIAASGGIDGIALHINSRGYAYGDIHSTAKVNAGGQMLYWSFYVYKDWVNLGIPSSLYHLPLYATECNGMYYWKGGHPEDPSKHYEPGWMQEIFAEINRYNQTAATTGKPIYRSISMYRWCAWCDGWNIDGGDNPYKAQILSDHDVALAVGYTWPSPPTVPVAAFTAAPTVGAAPLSVQFTDQSTGGPVTSWNWTFGDGGVSTSQNPQHTYTSAGAYTVSLTATGAAGSDVETKSGYITVNPPPGPGDPLLVNGDFAAGMNGWTVWTQRNEGGDFAATATAGALHEQGGNYNGGAYQQFSTGGAGKTILVSGFWQSTPTIASSQWGEVTIINSSRLPANGVDETPASKADDVLVFKNDTWTTPGGWSGTMISTSPVANVGQFVAAGDRVTLLIKSGNSGAGQTGLTVDNLYVRIQPGDWDNDGDVDLADYAVLADCLDGPNALPTPSPPKTAAQCRSAFDYDADSDVDLKDVRVFQAEFTGG